MTVPDALKEYPSKKLLTSLLILIRATEVSHSKGMKGRCNLPESIFHSRLETEPWITTAGTPSLGDWARYEIMQNNPIFPSVFSPETKKKRSRLKFGGQVRCLSVAYYPFRPVATRKRHITSDHWRDDGVAASDENKNKHHMGNAGSFDSAKRVFRGLLASVAQCFCFSSLPRAKRTGKVMLPLTSKVW